jgi:hypothetical protein
MLLFGGGACLFVDLLAMGTKGTECPTTLAAFLLLGTTDLCLYYLAKPSIDYSHEMK